MSARDQLPDLINEITTRIFNESSGPAVRLLLLRDVLKREKEDHELEKARAALSNDPCVLQLGNEQRKDGGWGAFHSQDTKNKQLIKTTETGVERAIALGLERSHPILKKVRTYLISLLTSEIEFPDRPERNDRWQTGVRLITASTLAQIDPRNQLLDQDRDLWLRIFQYTFRSGRYSEDDEIEIHRKLTNATVKGSYLTAGNRYQLNLLGSMSGLLSEEIQRRMLRWLWEQPEGIRYLTVPLDPPGAEVNSGYMDRWLRSHDLLSRLFPVWVDFSGPVCSWLIRSRNVEGWWDFGQKPPVLSSMPLSMNWRDRSHRFHDWSTRVLILLKRFSDLC